MKKPKRDSLEKLGYRVTDTKTFLKLSDHEIKLIDLKVSLVKKLREVRKQSGLTQIDLAKLMKTSQSRIAMLEGGAPDVSLELICKALFTLGLTTKDLGKAIATRKAA